MENGKLNSSPEVWQERRHLKVLDIKKFNLKNTDQIARP